VIWLTIKQHRFETLAIVIICLGLAAAALIEAYRLTALNVPLACLNSWRGPGGSGGPIDAAVARCNELAGSFLDLKVGLDMGLTQQLLLLAPLVVGTVLGAPMVAAEIENGTASLTWVHSGSRRPWLAGKVLAGMLLLVPLMLAMGLAADVLEAASAPTVDAHASFDGYLGRGVMDIPWALAAFMGALALGAIFGRTIPAVIVALVICFLVRSSWDTGMTHLVLRPFGMQQSQPNSVNAYLAPQADLPVRYAYYLDGQPFYGDVYAWYAQHPPAGPPDAGPTPSPNSSVASGNGAPGASVAEGPILVTFVIPGSWYWKVVGLESGLLLLGALICGGVATICVDRRRPY
jgi:hypothetical protein